MKALSLGRSHMLQQHQHLCGMFVSDFLQQIRSSLGSKCLPCLWGNFKYTYCLEISLLFLGMSYPHAFFPHFIYYNLSHTITRGLAVNSIAVVKRHGTWWVVVVVAFWHCIGVFLVICYSKRATLVIHSFRLKTRQQIKERFFVIKVLSLKINFIY